MVLSLAHYFAAFVGISFVGLSVVFFLFNKISRLKVTNAKANKIASAIADGAMTFLREEYKIIAIFALCFALFIAFAMSPLAGVLFIFGAAISMLTGFIGMRAATIANVRTTIAAKEKGEHSAFLVAFFGGGVMGFAVASFGLLGLGTIFCLFLSIVS